MSAAPVEGVLSKEELPERLLLGDDKQAKRRTSIRHSQAMIQHYTTDHLYCDHGHDLK